MTGEALRRQAHRERNGWGKRPLCAWLGIPTDGDTWDVARRYLRWCKRNPQPRVDKR